MIVRRRYPKEFKREIAQAYLSGTHVDVLVKKHKLPPGNIHRWARKYGNGSAKGPSASVELSSKQLPVPVPAGDASPETALTVFKRPATGRYPKEVRKLVTQVLMSGSLTKEEVAERTRIHVSTLYAWQRSAESAAAASAQQVEVRRDESTVRVNVTQAAVLLKKARADLIKGTRNGSIDDPYDPIYMTCMQAYNSLMGRG